MSVRAEASLRLLVPIDGSPLGDQALPYAAALAKPDGEILLLHVAPLPEPPRTHHGVDGVLDDAFRAVGEAASGREMTDPRLTDQDLARRDQQARRVTQNSASLWQSLIPHAQQKIAFGDPAEQILHTAAETRADLIVMASHGRGALGRWRYGSVTDRIARASPVPVLIIRPQDAGESFGPGAIHRLVVTLDGSALAEQALPVVRVLAAQLHKPVHLIRVVHSHLHHREADEPEASEAIETLTQTAAELATTGAAVTWSVERGEPFTCITEATRQGDLLVLASHGRSGLTRWTLGSMAEKLIRLAEVPILVVRATSDVARG